MTDKTMGYGMKVSADERDAAGPIRPGVRGGDACPETVLIAVRKLPA